MYYTYVLKSHFDNKLYTGYTKDLKKRFEQHTCGYVKSTKDRLPLELIYYEACICEEDAIRREKYLKTYRGKMSLKNRLKSYFTGQQGDERGSNKDAVRFFYISKGSLAELETQLEIAFEIGYLGENELKELLSQSARIGKMLGSLIKVRTKNI